MASFFLCYQFIIHSVSNQKYKTDYAELNHVKHGLLNVGEWKKKVSVILAQEINTLHISKKNERAIKREIEVLLNRLIDEVDEKIKKSIQKMYY